MRGVVVACTFFGSTAFAGAAVLLAPPVIREPWTPLPCPEHPKTTVAQEGCLEHNVSRSDGVINREVAIVFRLIRADQDRAEFVGGERSWLSYRRRSCTALASPYTGGSVHPLAYLSCEKRLNAEHISDLAATEQALRRG
jgi:uncharacterized protein YecT (DUF1311 family)